MEKNNIPQIAHLTEHFKIPNYPELLKLLMLGIQQLNQLNESAGKHAISETLRVDISENRIEGYLKNVQRILDCMKYDSISDFNYSKVISYDNAVVIHRIENYNITDDSGACVQLAYKTAAWLKIMYPDREYFVGEITLNELGGNHFCVAEDIGNEELFIIDPSFNKFGTLDEADKWFPKIYDAENKSDLFSKTQSIQYSKMVLGSIHNGNSITKTITDSVSRSQQTNAARFTMLPLVSPRMFGAQEQLGLFGVSLALHSDYDVPLLLITTKSGEMSGYPLDITATPESMSANVSWEGGQLPIELSVRILEMWKTIVDSGGIIKQNGLYQAKN